jgi:mRNA interferase MazF
MLIMKIKQGDVFWVTLAEQDDSNQSGPHPHVVIQEDTINQSRVATVVTCALTTNLKRAEWPGNVLLAEGEGNLKRASVVLVSQVQAVEKSALGEHIGTLSVERVEQILSGMRFLQAMLEKP